MRNFRDIKGREMSPINSGKIIPRFFPRRFDNPYVGYFINRHDIECGHDLETEISRPTAILSSNNDFTQNACVMTLFRLSRHSVTLLYAQLPSSAENGADDSLVPRKLSRNFKCFKRKSIQQKQLLQLRWAL